jgi:hypothetical protein
MWTASTPPDEATDDVWASFDNRLRREQPIDEPDTDSSEDVDDFAPSIAFPDEPGDELTYELDDNDLDDDDLAIIAAERAAIQDEANSLPLEPDELSTSPPTFTDSPPLDDEDATQKIVRPPTPDWMTAEPERTPEEIERQRAGLEKVRAHMKRKYAPQP